MTAWFQQTKERERDKGEHCTVKVEGRENSRLCCHHSRLCCHLLCVCLQIPTQRPMGNIHCRNGFKLEFSSDPSFQHSAPSNVSMDASQLPLCSAEVEVLTEKGAIVESCGEDGCISRYFLIAKKGVNKWRPRVA